MSIEKRARPNVDLVTPELAIVLAMFSDEEISSGVIASGAALPDERCYRRS